ncbi:hypothetical protein K493DRAFT_338265 [Basidiobolus meristosporus CBS 931.73]|uniref:Arrestin C-terminal-like domain-containing protein n=1 Tax=Basidiobolus meristosporus CBS 931.73 TaxID=1314790 RepID=A0A1Y1Y5Y0_9FUNG|nr:hypothetical protein K493DRAFT_338265 [Basidiobolus meristosporus CBS 931.73]|eukprot:ORX93427.1 hypothetical protein K493DRAFT_338265 [Basidiobolus meristosporus CBS 931.73]
MTRKTQLNIVLDQDTFYKGYNGTGDHILSGTLIFAPNSTIKVNKISLQFEGRYTVATTSDIRKNETIFYRKEWSFLNTATSQTFKSGQINTYDFTLAMPRDLPESVKSESGSIQYKFKAVVDTTLLYSKLKAEKPVHIWRYADSLLTPRHITHLEQEWENKLSCQFTIPNLRFSPGDEFPLQLQHEITDNTRLDKILLAACLLKQRIVYKSPKNPNQVVRVAEKKLDMSCVWFREERVNNQKVLMVKIPSSLKVYDSNNEYIEVSHRLEIRIDVSFKGKLSSAHFELPILVASPSLGADEELPSYTVVPSPPSYECSMETALAPPHYSTIVNTAA